MRLEALMPMDGVDRRRPPPTNLSATAIPLLRAPPNDDSTPDMSDLQMDSPEARRDLMATRRRTTLFLTALFWLLAFAVLSIRGAFTENPDFFEMAPRRLIIAAFGTLLCAGMIFALARLRPRAFAAQLAWGVAGALVMAALIAAFALGLNRVLLPFHGALPPTADEAALWVMVWFGYCLAWTGTHLALTYHWEAVDQQRNSAFMRDLAQEARVAALRYQLNPHFLFNTLNSISSLVLEGHNAEAEAMLLNLSTFLRSTLGTDPGGVIALSEEIGLQQLYLAIEEARFSERMKVSFDVPESLARAPVPPLILQPLVENAVRYAVGPSEGMTRIRIAADRCAGDLRLRVEDDGSGRNAPPAGSGLGLANVRERLNAQFGRHARLETARLEGGGFRAELRIPLPVHA
jgi:signal transduction histidine kinase